MSALQLLITIDSRNTDGNPEAWQWAATGTTVTTNPPPRMQINDTFSIVVTDQNPSPTALDGYMIMGPKVENPLTGVTGKASPLKQGNDPNANASCVASWPAVQGNNGVFNFNPPDNTFLEAGAWEVTFVVSCPALNTQFELDPEFDTSN